MELEVQLGCIPRNSKAVEFFMVSSKNTPQPGNPWIFLMGHQETVSINIEAWYPPDQPLRILSELRIVSTDHDECGRGKAIVGVNLHEP